MRAAIALVALAAVSAQAAQGEATAVFVTRARLADPVALPTGDDRDSYDQRTFERLVGSHTIVSGDRTVIAIRRHEDDALDRGDYYKLSISLPGLSWEGALPASDVTVRFSGGNSAFGFSPQDYSAKNLAGRLSVRAVKPELLAIDVAISFEQDKEDRQLAPVLRVDCSGHGEARVAARDDLTSWYGAPTEVRHKYDGIRPRGTLAAAPFDLRCTSRIPGQ